MPIPTDVTGIRSFFGMCSYYRTYIKDFARLCHPMYNLTKNGAVFKMEEEALGSINAFKIAMANTLINQPFSATKNISFHILKPKV